VRTLAIVVLFFVAVSCSSGGTSDKSTSTPSALPGLTRHEAGIPVLLPPRATSSSQVDPQTHAGEEIFITKDGPRPQSLFAKIDALIFIYNETDTPQRLHFLQTNGWKSPNIAPHSHVSYKPMTTGSYTYAVDNERNTLGYLNVEPWREPEDTGVPAPTFTPAATP